MSKVTLSVIAGPSTGATFEYTDRTIAIAGRADDCNPQIVEPGPQAHVSRHHCLFDINPPDIRVRDFGSLNGTHVNGVEVGRRAAGQTPEEGARNAFRERDLVDGDRIALGATVLAVTVESDRETVVTPTRRVAPRFEPGSRIDKLLSDAAAGQPDLAGIRGFEIVSELGRGGQGVVYLARHESNGELVALKVLLAAIAVQRKARDEFLREISGMRALRHPNVVGLREAGSAGDTFFFTSEFCPGGSVDDLVRKGGVLNPEDAVAITLQALDGLAYTHSVLLGPEATGLVHRDIKPGNILLSSTGPDRIAKVGDFRLGQSIRPRGTLRAHDDRCHRRDPVVHGVPATGRLQARETRCRRMVNGCNALLDADAEDAEKLPTCSRPYRRRLGHVGDSDPRTQPGDPRYVGDRDRRSVDRQTTHRRHFGDRVRRRPAQRAMTVAPTNALAAGRSAATMSRS